MMDRINAGFVSDLTPLLEKADLWLHGHVHDSLDYQVDRCRVVANPTGYVKNLSSARTPDEFEYENPRFNLVNFERNLVLEIES